MKVQGEGVGKGRGPRRLRVGREYGRGIKESKGIA